MTVAPQSPHPVRLRVAETAKIDIEDLLAWSEQRFGVAARQRYEALLARALLDVSEDVVRSGVRARPELGAGMFSYHLHFSRKRAVTHACQAVSEVHRRRHFLVWRSAEDRLVEILRLLHDAMELSRHLPEDSP